MSRKILVTVGLVALLAIAPALAGRVDFKPIDGALGLTIVDFTADGSMAVMSGSFGGGAFIWTEDGGIVQIGSDGCSGQLRISDDGSTIVGTAKNPDGNCEAAMWDGSDWQLLGGFPGGLPCGTFFSSTYDTNNDMAVGLGWLPQQCHALGATWDLNAGMFAGELASSVPNRPTRGNAISADSSIIGGWQDGITGFRQGAKWVNGTQELMTDDNGNMVGEILAMNGDASAIVGTGWSAGDGRGWLWRAGQGMIPMGRGAIGRNIQTAPVGVTADGNTVVGIVRDFDQFIQDGFIWTDKHGYVDLDDFVKGKAAAGWDLQVAAAITADGSRMAGWGINPNGQLQGFIIDLGATGPK